MNFKKTFSWPFVTLWLSLLLIAGLYISKFSGLWSPLDESYAFGRLLSYDAVAAIHLVICISLLALVAKSDKKPNLTLAIVSLAAIVWVVYSAVQYLTGIEAIMAFGIGESFRLSLTRLKQSKDNAGS